MASEQPSELSLLNQALENDTPVIEDITKRLRELRPQAKGPRPTPIPVSPRKRKRRAARDARKLNRGRD